MVFMKQKQDGILRIIILFCIISGGILIALIFTQNIYTDEFYYYLPAARQISRGMQLYKDFFFPQMPLSALVFLPFSSGGWSNFFLARVSSSILTLLSGVILLLYTFHINKSKKETIYMGILWTGNAVLFYNSIQATQRAWVNLLNILFLILFSLYYPQITVFQCFIFPLASRAVFHYTRCVVGIVVDKTDLWLLTFTIFVSTTKLSLFKKK